eukprot:1448523-Pyramimonas_sp.AAC.1
MPQSPGGGPAGNGHGVAGCDGIRALSAALRSPSEPHGDWWLSATGVGLHSRSRSWSRSRTWSRSRSRSQSSRSRS